MGINVILEMQITLLNYWTGIEDFFLLNEMINSNCSGLCASC